MPTYFAREDGSHTPERARSRAHLVVLSDELMPDVLASRIGIVADQAWERGGRSVGTSPQAHHGLSFESRISEERGPDEHLADLVERLRPVAAQIAELGRDPAIFSVRVWISHHGQNWNPGLSLTKDLIQGLESLGVGLDIDIYVIPDDVEPPSDRDRAERVRRPH